MKHNIKILNIKAKCIKSTDWCIMAVNIELHLMGVIRREDPTINWHKATDILTKGKVSLRNDTWEMGYLHAEEWNIFLSLHCINCL